MRCCCVTLFVFAASRTPRSSSIIQADLRATRQVRTAGVDGGAGRADLGAAEEHDEAVCLERRPLRRQLARPRVEGWRRHRAIDGSDNRNAAGGIAVAPVHRSWHGFFVCLKIILGTLRTARAELGPTAM
jgi:hypothetical protein